MTAIAIIGAMDEEVANIATALSNVTVTEEAGVKVTRGTLETNKAPPSTSPRPSAAWAPSTSPPPRSI